MVFVEFASNPRPSFWYPMPKLVELPLKQVHGRSRPLWSALQISSPQAAPTPGTFSSPFSPGQVTANLADKRHKQIYSRSLTH